MESDLDTLESLIEAGDLDAARRLVDKVVPPEDAEHTWRLARALDLHLDRGAEAEVLYRIAAAESLDALVDLSLFLDEQGREDDTELELRLRSAETESAARVLRGRHYRAHGFVEPALREYERGVALGDQTALRYLAGTLSYTGRPARAEQLYRHAPLCKDSQLELDYADFLWELGRLDEAEARLRELVRQGNVEAERALADLLGACRPDSAEPIAHYLAAILLDDALAVNNLGIAFRDQSRMLEAEFALRQAWADGDELAGTNLGELLNDSDRRLRELQPFVVPEGWQRAAGELRSMRADAQIPPDWVTLLHAAQLVHLRGHAASADEIAAHLRRSRWLTS